MQAVVYLAVEQFISHPRVDALTNPFPQGVNERSKLTRFQHLSLTHPMWRKAPRRAALK